MVGSKGTEGKGREETKRKREGHGVKEKRDKEGNRVWGERRG